MCGLGRRLVPSTKNYDVAGIGAFDVTLQAFTSVPPVPGTLNFTQTFDGGTKADLTYCDAGTGPLKCDSDGAGVGASDDEITLNTSESIFGHLQQGVDGHRLPFP